MGWKAHVTGCVLACLGILLLISSISAVTTQPSTQPSLYSDDFTHGLDHWSTELENGGKVTADNGSLDIDVPAGCTVWFKQELTGPVAIEYDATAIKAGGENDRVSDLNCFWMARNRDEPASPLAKPRTGKFADYNDLLTYYVGYGGNTNTTTRFRRYIGDKDQRPLLPEHDLQDAPHLLTANKTMHIRLVAAGSTVQFFRDGEKVFDFHDDKPYTAGWFGFRTVKSHLRISGFRVYRIDDSTARTRP
jgi:hypothetical protein